MICVSIQAKDYSELLSLSSGVEFAEVRLDNMPLDQPQMQDIFGSGKKRVVTCRPGALSDAQRLELLGAAAACGATYVDVELENEPQLIDAIRAKCLAHNSKLIISHHNFRLTPDRKELERLTESCFSLGAEIAKVACFVKASQDNAKLLSLLSNGAKVIPIGLGPLGRITRIVAPLLGSPFSYASVGEGSETAPGQLSAEALAAAIKQLKECCA